MNVLNFVKDEMKIRVREDEGCLKLNIEDVAMGLGFTTVATSGNECVRWSRVNKYLSEITDSQVIAVEMVDEWVFYMLCMKAKNEKAVKFQKWIATEVIPNIRKSGGYISEEATSEQLDELRNKIDILQGTVDNFDNSTLNNNRLSRKLKDFLEQMFLGKVDNPYDQFIEKMKLSGMLDENNIPTDRFIELNQNNGKVFRYKVDICTQREEWFTVTNVGMSYLSKTLREKDGKIVSVKHLTDLK